ncbi:unnamed protein product [Porites evermanni]|uniref:Uncharacterized protein n=1 Tax=Porites evermanni TaxID=104178 RepID=A0ABN8Q1I0_9CNID|nr:unnamed protein product [Porites evermanni]
MTFFQVVCLCGLFFVAVIAESKDPEKELFELADLDFDNMGPDMSKPINMEVVIKEFTSCVSKDHGRAKPRCIKELGMMLQHLPAMKRKQIIKCFKDAFRPCRKQPKGREFGECMKAIKKCLPYEEEEMAGSGWFR